MKKKVLSLMLGVAILGSTSILNTKVFAAPTKTHSQIINGDDKNNNAKILMEGSIGPWTDESHNVVDVEDKEKPKVSQLSVTIPVKMAFTVSTNTKELNNKGTFISPEYKISNNGASSSDVKVTLESVLKKNAQGKLELDTVKNNDGKVQIDLKLKLGNKATVDVRENSTKKELGTITRGSFETLQLLSSSWELPTSELGDGTEVVKSTHELVLGFELKSN